MTPARSQVDVVVVGGGLAGISAAIELAEAGLSVTLLEARPWLGGATCSFARRGLTIDNGQHVFLRGCQAYRALLARLGVTSSLTIQDRLELTVLGPTMLAPGTPGSAIPELSVPEPPVPEPPVPGLSVPGLSVPGPPVQLTLRRWGLPAPFHLARALAGYRLLSKRERVRAAAAMAVLPFADRGWRGPAEISPLDFGSPDFGPADFGPAEISPADVSTAGVSTAGISLGDWLARYGQDENARRMFWDLLSVTAVGLPADEADLSVAASAIRFAVLASRENADIGVPAVPLSKLHAGPAAALLSGLGARVLLGVKAAGVRISAGGGYDIRLHPAIPPSQDCTPRPVPDAIRAAGLVLAVPAWEAAALAPAELSAAAARWARLEAAPLVSLHVIYGSPVTRLPYAAVVDSPVRWVIDKSGPAGLHTGQYLAASVPAADRYVDLPASRLRAELLPELERLFPAAADAEVQDFFITRERRAMIRHVPGSQQLRAGQPAGLPGLALAGAWTDTGLPDTMEGAVRSGRTAALKVLAELARPGLAASTAAAVPDGPLASMARAI